MLYLIRNNLLVKNRERTYLTADVSAAGTTLTVKAVDADVWSDNDWLIVGEIGSPNAEVLQVNGAPSDGTSLTVDNAGSGGARYAHSANEPVYRIDYNQIKIYRATTEDGAKTNLTTVDLQPRDHETRYEDGINQTGFGFVTFYNSDDGSESPYSDAIPYAGQSDKSLSEMRKQVRKHIYEQDDEFVTDEEIDDAINARQRDVINERLWTFNEVERSQSTVVNQFDYDLDSDIKTLHTLRVNSIPVKYVSRAQWENFHTDTDATAETPQIVSVWDNNFRFYPRPDTAAPSSTLNGDITASDTTITVNDISGFKRADYYRFIINSEVIYATGVDTTNNQFTGCIRAREGTTASAHTSGDTVTERNVVYTGQLYPTDLKDENDETIIPEPDVLVYGAAADLANGKLKDPERGDRMEIKYSQIIERLRNKFSIKFTSQMSKIKVREEVDPFNLSNPNDHPSNIIVP